MRKNAHEHTACSLPKIYTKIRVIYVCSVMFYMPFKECFNVLGIKQKTQIDLC